MRMFKQHSWPGNFRQLTNLLRTAIVMLGDDTDICVDHLPDDFLDDISHARRQEVADTVTRVVSDMSTLEDVEASVIRKSLEAHGGNVSATARALGVSRNTIYRKLHH